MDNSIAEGIFGGGILVVVLSGWLMTNSFGPGSSVTLLTVVLDLLIWVGLMISAIGVFFAKGTILGNVVAKSISVVAMVASAILIWGVIFTRPPL